MVKAEDSWPRGTEWIVSLSADWDWDQSTTKKKKFADCSTYKISLYLKSFYHLPQNFIIARNLLAIIFQKKKNFHNIVIPYN